MFNLRHFGWFFSLLSRARQTLLKNRKIFFSDGRKMFKAYYVRKFKERELWGELVIIRSSATGVRKRRQLLPDSTFVPNSIPLFLVVRSQLNWFCSFFINYFANNFRQTVSLKKLPPDFNLLCIREKNQFTQNLFLHLDGRGRKRKRKYFGIWQHWWWEI
jgi:hypothetical protein